VGACAAFVGATLVALVLAVALSEAIFADAFRDEAQTRWQPRQLLDFSLPVMVMSVTQLGLSHVNVLLIGFWRPSEDVGIYAAAAALATLGVFVMLAVGQILEPVMAELHSRGDLGGLSAVFQTAAKWGIAGGTPVCLFLILQGRGTLGVFGSEFQAGAACLAVLCLGQMVNGLTGHAGPALVMCGRQWPNLAVTAAGAALNITLCFLLVPRYGIVGGAVASAAALAIVKVTRLVALVRLVGVRPYRMATFRPAATAVVCALPLLLWRTDQWAWALVCFAAYVAAVAALNVVLGLEPDDRMVLDRLLRRDQREGPPGDMERK
jgi:O-antigen/teichoic acid export membrane protein